MRERERIFTRRKGQRRRDTKGRGKKATTDRSEQMEGNERKAQRKR